MKNILFVCTGNSARSIIAESIINNEYDDLYKGFSAGSNPTGKINEDVKNYLLSKHYDLSNYRSKNFDEFTNNKIKIDSIISIIFSIVILIFSCAVPDITRMKKKSPREKKATASHT